MQLTCKLYGMNFTLILLILFNLVEIGGEELCLFFAWSVDRYEDQPVIIST